VRGSGRGELLLAEGIEDTLTAALMLPGRAAWAGIDAGNLAAVVLPPEFSVVIFVRQRDGDNPAVRRDREKAIDTWRAEGRSVRFVDPLPGYKDVNEWWQARHRASGRAA
jgi:hypothetical protein